MKRKGAYYRTSRTGRTNGETVSHNGFTGFTQRFHSFPTTDLLITSCDFTHNQLRFHS